MVKSQMPVQYHLCQSRKTSNLILCEMSRRTFARFVSVLLSPCQALSSYLALRTLLLHSSRDPASILSLSYCPHGVSVHVLQVSSMPAGGINVGMQGGLPFSPWDFPMFLVLVLRLTRTMMNGLSRI